MVCYHFLIVTNTTRIVTSTQSSMEFESNDDGSPQNPKKRTRLQMMSDNVARSGRDVPIGKVDILQQTMSNLRARVQSLNEANREAVNLRKRLEMDLQLAEGRTTASEEARERNESDAKTWAVKASREALDIYECQIEHANELIYRLTADSFHKKIAMLTEIKDELTLGSIDLNTQEAPETLQNKFTDLLQDETLEIIKGANEPLTRTERQLTFLFDSEMYKRLDNDEKKALHERYADLYNQATRVPKDVVKTLADVIYKRFQVFTNYFISEGGLETIKNSTDLHASTEDILNFINFTLSMSIEADESFRYSLEEGYFYGLLFARVKVPEDKDTENALRRVSKTIQQFLFANDYDSDSENGDPSKRMRPSASGEVGTKEPGDGGR